jgi:hypothetical protein
MAGPKEQKSAEPPLKMQFVPRSEHNVNALERPVSQMASNMAREIQPHSGEYYGGTFLRVYW